MSNNGCGCRCGGSEILSIPKGNDFRAHVCCLDVVTGMMDKDIDLTEVEDMRVDLVTWLGRRWEAAPTPVDDEGSDDSQGLTWETDGKDIIISVPAEMQKCTVYAMEVTGTHQGRPFRWKTRGLFRIVETHCESSVQGMETFDTEDYYLRDELWVG